MSDLERFTWVAHDKWANEQFAQIFLTKGLKSYFMVHFWYIKKQTSDCSLLFLWAMRAKPSARSPKMSNHKQFAQVAHQKRATMSDSLRSLTKNERPWAILSGRSPKMSDHKRFAKVAHQKWATISDSLRSLTKNGW